MSDGNLPGRVHSLERKLERLEEAYRHLTSQVEEERAFYRTQVAPALNKLVAGANVSAMDLVTVTAFLDAEHAGWDVEFRKAIEEAAREQQAATGGTNLTHPEVLAEDREYAGQLVEVLMKRFQQRVALRVLDGRGRPATPSAGG